MTSRPILSIKGLHVEYESEGLPIHAVRGVSFDVFPGETLAIVGESGSGKSATALALLGLSAPGRSSAESMKFGGKPVSMSEQSSWEQLRWREISMVFQDPLSALNPVLPVGTQIDEVLVRHLGMKSKTARAHSISLLRLVGLPAAEQRYAAFPHQLSGGMRQRVMIAMAVACRPRLLVADEPTTALDVTVQRRILDLISELQKVMGLSTMLITHDFGVVAGVADRIIVMYAGRIVEAGTAERIFYSPEHPYTKALLESIPTLDPEDRTLRRISGEPPEPTRLPAGCAFASRCPVVMPGCASAVPPLILHEDHEVACWKVSEADS